MTNSPKQTSKINKKDLEDGGYVLYSGRRDENEEEIDVESLVHENTPEVSGSIGSPNIFSQENSNDFEQEEKRITLFKGTKKFSGKIKTFIYEEDEHKALPVITVVFEVEP